ncbi:MAG: response regulator [Planctomycetota bacterium]
MSKTTTAIPWPPILMLLGLAVGAGVAGKRAHDATQNALRASDLHAAVQGVARADAVLDAAVLDVRHRHTEAFDELVSALDACRASMVQLGDALQLDSPPGCPLVGGYGDLETVASQKFELLERFKSQYAILGNSQRYLPSVAAQAATEAARIDESGQLSASVLLEVLAGLDTSATRSDLRSIEDIQAKLQEAIEPFDSRLGDGSPLHLLQRHVARAIENGRATDASMSSALAKPVRDRVRALRERLEDQQVQAVSASATYREVLLFVVGALLIVSAHSWFRMRRQHQLVREDNELLESKIRERTIDLEAASKAKSEFLANMSHEIRTPMTAILGYADILRESTSEPAERDQAIASIHRNGQFLLAILNDVLDLSKIESGHMLVEDLEVDPFEVLSGVHHMMAERAEQGGLQFEVHWPDQMPRLIRTDPVRWTQVLMNLVSNALKFTKKGSVILDVALDREAPEKLIVAVRDTGIGIEPEKIPGLFDAFTQADSSTTRRFGGTGLGLAISAKIAQLLGGSLTASSEPGVGSAFVIEIATGVSGPLSEAELSRPSSRKSKASGRTRAAAQMQRSGHILLVEDGRDNQLLISRMLRKRGLDVSIAENGQEARDAILATERPRYDLVLMDMQMPVMDGYTAAVHVREAGATLPIVAITAHAMEEDRQRCLQAGCNDFLTKPVDLTELDRVLDELLCDE